MLERMKDLVLVGLWAEQMALTAALLLPLAVTRTAWELVRGRLTPVKAPEPAPGPKTVVMGYRTHPRTTPEKRVAVIPPPQG